MTLPEIHDRFANTALLYFLIVSLWGYWRFLRKQGVGSSVWGALAIGEVILLFQSGLGAYLWVIGLRPGRTIHILYGVVSLMALPMAYVYTRGQTSRAEMLIYGTTSLITVGLILRAVSTGEG